MVGVILRDDKLLLATEEKQLAVFDLLQEKRLGHYFNDYRLKAEDCLPLDKKFTCMAVNADSTVAVIGTEAGTLRVLTSRPP
jgi:hypothetical protein